MPQASASGSANNALMHNTVSRKIEYYFQCRTSVHTVVKEHNGNRIKCEEGSSHEHLLDVAGCPPKSKC